MLLKVKDVDEVLRIMKYNFPNPVNRTERVPLVDSVGRILAGDVESLCDIPDFNKSVVDGYAVKSQETFGASEAMPALLKKVGEIRIGTAPQVEMKPGECIYVPTGGMMPLGSDAVIMIENTEDLGSDSIAVYKSVSPWENTIKVGEDIRKGQMVAGKNLILRPHHVGVLSSIGLEKVEVVAKPKVSIISTGDELVEPGKELKPGRIWDINSYSLAAAVLQDGGIPVLEGIVGDDRGLIRERLVSALEKSDVVLISGGSSAGFRDFTAEIIDELGDPGILVHGISIKPGKPTIIGKIEGKPVIGMPGQPVSSLVVYYVVISPVIRRMGALPPAQRESISAICRENYASSPGREEYLMVNLEKTEGRVFVCPVYGKSGMITTISEAKGMVRIPKNREGLYRGEEVEVILL
jgi:molybdopterin molybdotransferase